MSLGKENHVGQNEEQLKIVLETKEVCLQKLNDENDTLIRENKRLKKEKATLEKEKAKLENEKDDALSRLSKLAGQRLTDGNPAITDLGNPNRPAKVGERWASLYTDEWTDVYEDLTKQNKRPGNNNELPEKQLIKIVDWCYKRCLEIAKEQNNKIHETLWEVVRFIHLLGVKPKTLEYNKRIQGIFGTEDKTLIEAMKSFAENAKIQLQCSTTLVEAVKKKCCEEYISSNPSSFESEKHFIMKCSELCWHVLSSNPPMVIEYDNFENQPMDSNKFNKYNRSGITVEYVVWPALLLHKDGPVLAKGTVQTNYEDKTAARKKSSEDIFEPPKTCKPRTPTGNNEVTVPAPLHTNGTHFSKESKNQDQASKTNEGFINEEPGIAISDSLQCTNNALKDDFHNSGSDLKNNDLSKKNHPTDVSQKEYSKLINQLCTSKEYKSNGDSLEQVPANTDASGMCITDTIELPSLHSESINQSGLNKDVKPGSSLKTQDDEKINQTFRRLPPEEDGESNNIKDNSEVSAMGAKELKREPNEFIIEGKDNSDKMTGTDNNDVENEFENSTDKDMLHQCTPMNQHKNTSSEECHHSRGRLNMKYGELSISCQKVGQSQNERRELDDSKYQDDKYERLYSLEGDENNLTNLCVDETRDKYEAAGYNLSNNPNGINTNSQTDDSKVENKAKFYYKPGNELNGQPKHTGTIQRELNKVCERSKLPKEWVKPKKESKTPRKNSSS
ncbi:uncharacterized protein LOC127715633 isoform X2 [Mytilus californianus]|uniref:uncharacterized protein LOC127715633 isoform X1 n=1 Tax=Mytilus californianus TaxID=6549 RepID=UPI002248364B|nr:uncharacterized protein LOC127715633 isoform X1 [Mytilus californianus]XP_052077697.1 uncharacterized protein LOC127715633 isoform X2 [Mytilus californianus]